MSKAERCFCCAWELEEREVVHGKARTGVPDWKGVALCGVCALKIRDGKEALIYRGDEWVTVRLMKENTVVEDGEDLDVQS